MQLLESGKIKDQRRITSFKTYIKAIEQQLLEMVTDYKPESDDGGPILENSVDEAAGVLQDLRSEK